jgi:signal transduction histidine kinase
VRYASVLVAIAIATVLRSLLDPWLRNTAPHGLYLAATVYIAWRRGLGPALMCVVLGAITATFLFVQPRHALFTIYGVENQINLLLSMFLGVSVALLSESLRIAAAENALLYQQARDAEHRKDEFLAMLSHELRNPLVPIRNALYVLNAKGSDDPDIMAMRELVQRQVDHLIRMVDDLLDVSRMTRGLIELRREAIPACEVISAALEISRPLIDEKHQHITITLPPPDVRLHADRIRLTQAVANLLNNAARYTEPEGNIWASAEVQDGTLVVRIRDTGVGLSPPMLTRIFDMFEQVDAPGKHAQGGLGIGLTLARSLIEMHGGTIEAHSAGLGHGSEFVVRLPVVRETQMYERPDISRPAKPRLQQPRRRVLVIDDSVPAAQSMARVLELWKHDVRICYDAASALEMARTFQPEVVLSDISLPEMNGYQLAVRLRRLPGMEHARLIAITGHGQAEDRPRALQAGFDVHLLKPVSPDELAELLSA